MTLDSNSQPADTTNQIGTTKQFLFLLVAMCVWMAFAFFSYVDIRQMISVNIEMPPGVLTTPLDIHSPGFNQLNPLHQMIVRQQALLQYTISGAVVFLGLAFAYNFHIFFLLQNFYQTFRSYRGYAGRREMGAHAWYLLIVIIVFPLALAVIPEFSTSFNEFKPEILSKVVLATLSNLIVILLTAELSTLYFTLDQDDLVRDFRGVLDKLFKDLRLKQLLVAIVLDILTFYFISRLPSLRHELNFENVLILLLLYVAVLSLVSSFGAMFTLSTNEKILRFKDREGSKL